MALTLARNGLWALLMLLVGGGLSYALLVGKADPEPDPAPEFSPPMVDVVIAAPGVRSLTVETQGTVRPLREIQLVSQVGGRVEEVSPRFAQGAFFAADEALVKIEDVDYQFVIARAQSQVAAAQQRVAEEEGRALQAKREWRDLGSDQGNALFLRKPQLASAQAALKASEADLAAAELDLTRTRISGPFNGRIAEKYVDVGQFVAPGTSVATIYDTDVAQIRLPLTDRQVALLDLPLYYDSQSADELSGAPVLLRATFAGQEWEWHGRVVRTDASIDVNSRVVYAVAEVEKPFARDPDSGRPPLSPGLFVHASISGRQLQQVFGLPRSALHTDGSVMVAGSDQRALARQVNVLQSEPDRVWVQGLNNGDRVIVRESRLVVVGMEVAVNVVDEQVSEAR
jgi:RND family efflux transporter MFP subunit